MKLYAINYIKFEFLKVYAMQEMAHPGGLEPPTFQGKTSVALPIRATGAYVTPSQPFGHPEGEPLRLGRGLHNRRAVRNPLGSIIHHFSMNVKRIRKIISSSHSPQPTSDGTHSPFLSAWPAHCGAFFRTACRYGSAHWIYSLSSLLTKSPQLALTATEHRLPVAAQKRPFFESTLLAQRIQFLASGF